MTYKLFIDDERYPVDDGWIIMRSFDEACEFVRENGTPGHVQFDHDLGDGKTGHDFAKWLVDRALDGHGFPASYDVHSQNPIGAENIKCTMDAYYRHISD